MCARTLLGLFLMGLGLILPGSPLAQTLFFRVATPVRRDFCRTVPFTGEVLSRRSVRITALTSGRIVSLGVSDESRVRAGEVLFVLGGPEVEKRLGSLRTEIRILQQRILLAEKALKLKKKGFSARLIPYSEVLSAEEHLWRLKSELSSRQNAFHLLESYLRIRAPIAGIFTRRRVSVGQWVEKGTVLAEIVDPERVWIRALVFPPRGFRLSGKPARILLPDRVLPARVTRVAPEETPAGGRIVFLSGPELSRYLAPGETVKGRIVLAEHRNALALPRQAVIYDRNEKPWVFVKTPKGYVRRALRLGLVQGNWVEVLSGLKSHEKVVVQGAYELFYRNFPRTYHLPD